MEILIILLLSLFALGGKKDPVTFQRGGPGAGATGTLYGGSGRGGEDMALGKPTADSSTTQLIGMTGDPSGTAETLDEEASYTTESSGAMTGVMIGPHLR